MESQPSQPTQAPISSFGSNTSPGTPTNPKKKLFIILITAAVVVIVAGGALYATALVMRHNQAVQQAKADSAAKAKAEAAAKAKQGTIDQIETTLAAEFTQTKELDNRSIFSTADGLKQEADAAATVGSGNENGL